MMFVQDWEGTEPRDAQLIITNDPSINININYYIIFNININIKININMNINININKIINGDLLVSA